MGAYTATSWAIAYHTGERRSSTNIQDRKREVDLILTLPSGGEVPAGGVPLPAFGKVGMVRYLNKYILSNDIDTANFTTAAARAVKVVLNTTGNKAVFFKYGFTSGAGTASGGRALRALGTGITLTESVKLFVTAVGW